jgi:hypothetical protein
MPHTQTLLFTKDEWDAAMPMLTAAMTEFLQPYRTPVFIDRGDHGDGWGSGSFVEVDGRKYLLTNQHVATVRHKGDQLGVRYHGQDELVVLRGNHVEKDWPWDLALIPVSDDAWSCVDHAAAAISVDQIALAQTAYPTEVFAFSGYAGQNTSFHFETMFFGATTSLSREVELPADDRWDTRFHFGLDYRPDLAETVIGDRGLPTPPGLSGSTVWNTCFVEAKANGLAWTPDLARVAGVVWGWPSSQGLLVATRAEHVRSFMLGGPAALA